MSEKSPSKRPQFRMRTLLLLVAAVASWLAWYQTATQVRQLKQELPGLRRATRALIVDDTSQFAAVEKPQIWTGEYRWEVFVPSERSGKLQLALEKVTESGFPNAACSVPVGPGVNLVEYQKTKTENGWEFSLKCGDTVETTSRSSEWYKRSVTTTYVKRYSESRQQPVKEPLQLMRNRLRDGSFNTDVEIKAYQSLEVDGELIWIELD